MKKFLSIKLLTFFICTHVLGSVQKVKLVPNNYPDGVEVDLSFAKEFPTINNAIVDSENIDVVPLHTISKEMLDRVLSLVSSKYFFSVNELNSLGKLGQLEDLKKSRTKNKIDESTYLEKIARLQDEDVVKLQELFDALQFLGIDIDDDYEIKKKIISEITRYLGIFNTRNFDIKLEESGMYPSYGGKFFYVNKKVYDKNGAIKFELPYKFQSWLKNNKCISTNDKSVYIYDAELGRLDKSFELSNDIKDLHYLVISPDETKFAFITNAKVIVYDNSFSKVLLEENFAQSQMSPYVAWFPDNNRILLVETRSDTPNARVLDLSGKPSENVPFRLGLIAATACLSPDGTKYISAFSETEEVLDTLTWKSLYTLKKGNRFSKWSPTGNKFIASSSRASSNNRFVTVRDFHILNSSDGTVEATFENVDDIDFFDDSTIGIYSKNNNEYKIVSLLTGKDLFTLSVRSRPEFIKSDLVNFLVDGKIYEETLNDTYFKYSIVDVMKNLQKDKFWPN